MTYFYGMNNLDNLLRERGLRNDYIMQELNMVSSTYYRKKKDGTFTYPEIEKILGILNKIKPASFEDLSKSS